MQAEIVMHSFFRIYCTDSLVCYVLRGSDTSQSNIHAGVHMWAGGTWTDGDETLQVKGKLKESLCFPIHCLTIFLVYLYGFPSDTVLRAVLDLFSPSGYRGTCLTSTRVQTTPYGFRTTPSSIGCSTIGCRASVTLRLPPMIHVGDTTAR